MDAIVAVYADWGIGDGVTQPLVIPADRKRFRALTEGSAVIVGRKTLADFPGGRPLPRRVNLVLTRQALTIPDAVVVRSVEEALERAADYPRCFVIGGSSVFSMFFPHLDRVYLTKIEAAPHSTAFFPDLDADPDWACVAEEPPAEHAGVRYRFCVYERTRR